VRDAVNVDLNKARKWQRRLGYEQALEIDGPRNMLGGSRIGYFASGDQLYSFDGTTAEAIATLASPFARVSYAKTPLGLLWTDGYRLNIIANGVSQRAVPALPNPAPVISAGAGGALTAGTYGVTYATETAEGQQSAWAVPVYLDVPEGGSITVQQTGHTEGIAVFVTAVDGELFYKSAVLAVGQTSVSVPIARTSGQAVSYEVVDELQGGDLLAFNKGRTMVARGPIVTYSMPWSIGLYRPAFDYIPFPQDVTLIETVEGGTYIATLAETYWLPGGDISQAQLVTIANFGAVKGTATDIPNSKDRMWFTSRGPVRAGQNGELALLQDEQIAFEPMTEGAGMFREQQGLRQYVAAMKGSTGAAAAVFGSYMDAEVIQPGA
jgi:hypothetical protein